MSTQLSDIGEFGFIGWIAKTAWQGKDVLKGIGDDAAVIKTDDRKLLLFTTDMMKEGVHFTRDMGARSIGRKALACNISDIAAMGGLPTHAVVSLGVPKTLRVDFVKDVYRGMNALAREFEVSIVGGDTIASDKIIINVALLGKADPARLVLRSGANEGDKIFVTGPLGRSLATGKHLSFTPRIQESQFLSKRFKPTAMIDITDGLVADLSHILEQSNVGAILYQARIPYRDKAMLNEALYDGEDFELLFTLPAKHARRMIQKTKDNVRFYYIGDIVHRNEKLTLVDRRGRKRILKIKGFRHF